MNVKNHILVYRGACAKPLSRVAGLSLVEVLMVLTTSIVILMILFHCLLYAYQLHHFQQDYTQLRHSALKLTAEFTRVLQNAGNIGCGKLQSDFPMYPHSILNVDNKLSIAENKLTVRYGDFSSALTLVNSHGDTLNVSKEKRLKAGDRLIIADCKKIEFVTVRASQEQTTRQVVWLTRPLTQAFARNSEVGLYHVDTYYFTQNSLFVMNDAGKHLRLLGGLKSMIITQSDSLISLTIGLIAGNHVIHWNMTFYAG